MGRLLITVLVLILISCAGEKKIPETTTDSTVVIQDSVKNALIKDTAIVMDTIISVSKIRWRVFNELSL